MLSGRWMVVDQIGFKLMCVVFSVERLLVCCFCVGQGGGVKECYGVGDQCGLFNCFFSRWICCCSDLIWV